MSKTLNNIITMIQINSIQATDTFNHFYEYINSHRKNRGKKTLKIK